MLSAFPSCLSSCMCIPVWFYGFTLLSLRGTGGNLSARDSSSEGLAAPPESLPKAPAEEEEEGSVYAPLLF